MQAWRSPFTALALACIRLYQRHLSPRKGYGCAYRIHCSGASCSALGYRAIRRYGLWQGLPVLRARLRLCSAAYRAQHPPRLHPAALRQAGFCDGGDLPCDLPCNSDLLDCSCDAADCGSEFFGWNNERRNQRQKS